MTAHDCLPLLTCPRASLSLSLPPSLLLPPSLSDDFLGQTELELPSLLDRVAASSQSSTRAAAAAGGSTGASTEAGASADTPGTSTPTLACPLAVTLPFYVLTRSGACSLHQPIVTAKTWQLAFVSDGTRNLTALSATQC